MSIPRYRTCPNCAAAVPTAPVPELDDCFPVVLYFKTPQDVADFTAAIRETLPELLQVR